MLMFVATACLILHQQSTAEASYSFTRSQLIAMQAVARARSELVFTWDSEKTSPWHAPDLESQDVKQHPVLGFKGDAWYTTDSTLKALSAFPDIQYVHLAYCCRISDSGIQDLSQLKSLRTLVICRNHHRFGGNLLPVSASQTKGHEQNLTDESLKYISSFSTLRSLHIGDNQFSEAAILGLAQCSTLRFLAIDDSQLSDAAIDKLERALPNCEIHVWPGRRLP